MRRYLRPSAYRLTLIASMMLVLVLCAGVSFAQTDWTQWKYYVDVDVNTGQYARTATPVEMKINFTNFLNGATLNPDSVRVVEFADSGRAGTPVEVYSQFDKSSGYDATANAIGEVVWILRGTPTEPNANSGETAAGATRCYRVYFDDTTGSITAPSYTTDLTYDGTANPYIENIAYRLRIWGQVDTIYALYNKLTNVWMWKGSAYEYDKCGMYYSLNTSRGGWADQFYNYYASVGVSANRAVRFTYVSAENDDNYAYTMVRKFYSGVPYFKTEGKISKISGDGSWANLQIRYNDNSTVKRTAVSEETEANPILSDQFMPKAELFDYDAAGVNGGIGHLMGGDTLASGIGGGAQLCSVNFNYDNGGIWRYKSPGWFPVTLNHALMVHNGTTEAEAKAAVDKGLADYGCPVKIVIVGSSNTTTNYGAIGGKVTDADNANRTVKGALVRLWVNGTYAGRTITSALGDYTFSDVPAGTAKISVKCDGYDTLVVDNVTITAGTAITKDISLPSIIFAGKFINLKADSASGTWKFITDAVCRGVNVDPSNTTALEISTFAGPTLDSSITAVNIPVPNVYDTSSTETEGWDTIQADDNVYGWYRTTVNIPAEWAGKNIRLRDFLIDDALEVYLNGVKVASAAVLGSDTSWYSYPCDFIIPSSAVKPGEANVLAIKCYDNTGGGGIYKGGPVLEVSPDDATVTVNVKGPKALNGTALPIEGATVKIVGAASGTTDATGSRTFNHVKGDTYTITVYHSSYGTKTITNVEVPDTGEITVPVIYDTFLCKLTGTITRSNTPLAGARVIIADDSNYYGTITNSSGAYTITGVLPGEYKLTANALKAVPVIDKPVQAYTLDVALENIDLTYGVTPTYDDFSGTTLDTSKWGFFNTSEQGLGDSTATLVDGVLNLYPIPGRGGILSKTAIPKYGTSEVVFTQKATGANQGFAIIDPTYSGDIYGHGIALEQQSWFMKIFLCGSGNWQIDSDEVGYPSRISILRTGDFYDVYVNGQWGVYYNYSTGTNSAYLGKMPVDSNTGKTYLSDNAYIYLNGYRADMTASTIGYYDEIKAGATIPVTPTTLAGARAAADGSTVSFSGAVVTASYDNYFFVENTDRSAGMKVISTSKPAVGKVAFIAGSIVKADKEVAIKPLEATFSDDANVTVPKAVAVTGKVAGELDKVGAAAQGMLVKVAGTVTGVHMNTENKVDGYFLDDGSGIVGDGANKGIFVELDPAWGVTDSVVGKFKTVISPLTVKKINDVVLPAVKGKLDEIPSTFLAYNDCSWSEGQINTNITTYGAGSGFSGSTSGYLKEYTTGASFTVTATLTESGTTWSATGGANCGTGTDATGVFGGIVDFTGYIKCPTTSTYVDLTFSGLDPTGTYEFATSANGNDMTGDSITRFAISGVLAFTNASSSSAVISTDGSYTEFNTGMNDYDSMTGYVAKWTGIQPSADGTFTVRASTGGDGSNSGISYAFSGFMLKRTN
ncbi:MAG: carboxypeptidase regulatory-like domain-containing protein [Armatimonadota bacterium]